MQPSTRLRLTSLACALALAHCATNPVSGSSVFVVMSESQEVQAGRSEDPKVRQRYGVYGNPALQQYVNEIGERLARAGHRPNLKYNFLVIDSTEINASIMSFRGITSQERVLATPLTLRVIAARPGLTFAELARLLSLRRHAEGHLRVINGMYPSGEPVAGQALKIVE